MVATRNSGDSSTERRIERAFRRFHAENPHVYQELLRLSRSAKKSHGRERIGMKMLWEVMRWNLWLKIKTTDEFKLNNNYTSRYARIIMKNEPDLADLFETRELKS